MKKIIARISNGFGNQMFIYAAAFCLAKKLNRKLELDISSGLRSLIIKNLKKKFKHFNPKFELNCFNISSKITNKNNCYNNFFSQILRKFYIHTDFLKIKKKFIIESKNSNKITYYNERGFDNLYLQDKVYFEGYFECEKYFVDCKKYLIKEFSLKRKVDCNIFFKKQILNSNSVSMVIRADRFNERTSDDLQVSNILKSKNFELKQYKYIVRSMNYFKNIISNPKFFIFSDNIPKIKHMFSNTKNVIFIDQFNKNKVIEDYYLMSLCKHFAVGPTTFHFWPAWLSNYKNKIILRPKNMNPSNNRDFWPIDWIKI